jgi:hypothetical protein
MIVGGHAREIWRKLAKLGDAQLPILSCRFPSQGSLGPEDVGELWVHGVVGAFLPIKI